MSVEPDDLDLGGPIRTAMIEHEPIISLLGQWKGEPAIHTRRPVPGDSPYPLILINPPSAIGDEDGLTSDRPFALVDVAAYGRQPDQLREVEKLGFAMRRLFHRNKFALVMVGYSIIDIRAAGPMPAPVDDAKTVGRMVTLTIRLRRTS